MKKSNQYFSLLLAGLLAAAGAQAQGSLATGSSEPPAKAGEASNLSQPLAPNAVAPNAPVSAAPASPTREAVRQEAKNASGATTSSIPVKAGEASTTVQGQPNADPNNPLLGKTRAQVKAEVGMHRAQKDAAKATEVMGNTNYGTPVGTPPTAPAGTPSVFEGGTPK